MYRKYSLSDTSKRKEFCARRTRVWPVMEFPQLSVDVRGGSWSRFEPEIFWVLVGCLLKMMLWRIRVYWWSIKLWPKTQYVKITGLNRRKRGRK